MSSEIIRLTEQLVRIPTITGRRESIMDALKVVEEFTKGKDVEARYFESKGVPSLLLGDPNTLMIPRLLLSGHIDVVNASEDLFVPKREGNILTARGAGDMKGFLASMIVAYEKWVREHGSHGLGMLITGDEEVGGFNGARHVVEQGLRPGLVFVPDGDFAFDIVESQKAPHHFHVRAVGSGGHAAKAYEIDNPINRLMTVYEAMRKKYALATTEDEWRSTFEMTVIGIENASSNTIPKEVEAWFSWRWPIEQVSFEEGYQDMQALCEEHNCEMLPDEHGMGEGVYTDPDAPFVQDWKKSIEEVLGREVGFTNMHGATDARHFYRYGSNILTTSGVGGDPHADTEWVDLNSLGQLAKALHIYKQTVFGKN